MVHELTAPHPNLQIEDRARMSGRWPSPVSVARAFTCTVSPKTVWIVLELGFADGTTGWGEATLAGAEEAVLAEIRQAAALLTDRLFRGVGEALALLRMAQASGARVVTMHAVEQAFLDAL